MTPADTWLYLTTEASHADLVVYVTLDAQWADRWAFRTATPQLVDATIYMVNPDALTNQHGRAAHDNAC